MRRSSEGDVVRGEFKLRRKDGTPIWTMFSSTPMLDHEGRHVGNLTMHSDITELKAAEEALRRSDERFRMVLSAAPVTVAAQDEDLRFVWAFNQRTAPSDGVIGKTDADIFTAEEAEHLRAIKRRVLDEGSSSTSSCGSTGRRPRLPGLHVLAAPDETGR